MFDFEKITDIQKSENSKKTVIIGMSGGVDSSVCALILKKMGYNTIGLFMKNWEEDDEHGVCQASKEYNDVVKVCEKIGIDYYSVDFVKEYRENVFNQFVEEYKLGLTPNPDVLCNREIKFKVFFNKAMELGADYLATGHYCRHEVIDSKSMLVKGDDPGKDQTYFLYTMKEKVLEKVMFPIGNIEKSIVRKIAEKYDLATKTKKDSTGICFIGERNFKKFISEYISSSKGSFKTLSGEVVGKHDGVCFYTLGQRKGLGLGGQGDPWFVIDKDISNNVVIVERGEHPHMFCDDLTANEISWVNNDFSVKLPYKCFCKTRYRQKDQACTIVSIDNGKMKVIFEKPQRAITPRQSIVFYQDIDGHRVCLGGAMIINRGLSYHEMEKSLP